MDVGFDGLNVDKKMMVYVAHVANTTCRRRLPVSCRRDMSYDMSDMSSSVATTCRDVAPVEGALKTRHVATSRERAQLNYKFCAESSV